MPAPDPSSKIFLVGFMGVGKSTLGRMLAHQLGWPFLDIDTLIEDSEGASISTIFEANGEEHFRDLEGRTLSRLVSRSGRAVIACGGGSFCSAENQTLVHRHGVTVWLDQPFDQIWKRREGLAPLRPLMGAEPEVRRLYEERIPFYRLATLRVTVPEGKWADALEALLGLLKERGVLG